MNKQKRNNKLRIGTSGWHYDHWKGSFYPEELPNEEWLAYYVEKLSTVEINNSFYQLPDRDTLQDWHKVSPQGFIFSVKASRYITHMKNLKDSQEALNNLIERISVLDEKLGPILFQLPPNWNLDEERLRNFLEKLPEGYRFAFEFRDDSWFDNSVYDLLSAHRAAFCIYDFQGHVSPKEITTDWIYVRLHGPGDAYEGHYDVQTLNGWMGAFSNWLRQDKDIYCYFNNDQAGYAVQNALALQDMVKDEDGPS